MQPSFFPALLGENKLSDIILCMDIFAVNKPRNMTSHDVVNIIRKKTQVKRVGHGGTLDPLAEGVLVIAVGRENTKLLDKYVKGDKEYIATLKLGYVSETDDSQGPITEFNKSIVPKRVEIEDILSNFQGEIMQTPPLYSSIKIKGKPAHRRVRKGQNIQLKPRKVFIKKTELVSYDYPELELRIECGTGVYIRSIARDVGEKLKTGAYLTKLIRTRVGEFTVEDTLKIDEFRV